MCAEEEWSGRDGRLWCEQAETHEAMRATLQAARSLEGALMEARGGAARPRERARERDLAQNSFLGAEGFDLCAAGRVQYHSMVGYMTKHEKIHGITCSLGSHLHFLSSTVGI